MWIIKTNFAESPLFASGIYPGWSTNKEEATVFIDGQDNPEMKLRFFNAIVDIVQAGAKCVIERV